MKDLLITKTNANIIDDFGPALAEIYKYDFGQDPWYENSKCISETCPVQYREEMPLSPCLGCGEPMCAAYETEELITRWSQIVKDQDGMMELTVSDDNTPLRATIARPTNPRELYLRKYNDVGEMEPWLEDTLPRNLVWIEDTFANLLINNEGGNLAGRARTLGNIAVKYNNPVIATRTLAKAIVRATVRDAPSNTSVYVGNKNAGILQASGANLIGVVPDERTFLKIDNTGELR